MSASFVHTCIRVRDIDASKEFYGRLGFEQRGRLRFESAYNIYMGLPGGGDVLELTVNVGREEQYDLGDGYNHMALTVDDLDGASGRAGPRPGRARPPAVRDRAAGTSTGSASWPTPMATGSS